MSLRRCYRTHTLTHSHTHTHTPGLLEVLLLLVPVEDFKRQHPAGDHLGFLQQLVQMDGGVICRQNTRMYNTHMCGHTVSHSAIQDNFSTLHQLHNSNTSYTLSLHPPSLF